MFGFHRQSKPHAKKKMKRNRILAFILIMLLTLTQAMTAFAAKDGKTDKAKEKDTLPKISAQAWVLIDLKSGAVLLENDSEKEMYPASTTKIVSYLVVADAIKNGELSMDDYLTYTSEMQDVQDPDGSNIELKPGEKMTVYDLLSAMMIASGNDAATLLAISVGGDLKGFVKLMNEKADELSMDGSHFQNPHGLTDENHYTTAHDLARAAREAMKDEEFRKIVGSKTLKIAPTNKTESERYYINTNNLLSTLRYSKYYYDKATGIKTGHTEAAGSCLVASAKSGETELICVVLKSDHSHEDAKALLEYGFSNFKEVTLVKSGALLGEVGLKQAKGGADHLRGVAAKNATALLKNSADAEKVKVKVKYDEKTVYAPVKKGQKIGTAVYTYDGKTIGSVEVVAETSVERHMFGFLMSLGEAIWGSRIVRIIVYLIGIAALLFVLLIIYGFARAIKKSRSRKRRRGNYRPPMY